jgi:hypothetical protein
MQQRIIGILFGSDALWLGKVIVITYRRDRVKAIADLGERNIRYDEVVLVGRFEAKEEVIA